MTQNKINFLTNLKIKDLNNRKIIQKIFKYKSSLKLVEKNITVTINPGYIMWYKDGVRHRDGGPAVEHINGYKSWWRNGKLHREDGPAVERVDGYNEWWRNGKLHREDGPAVERVDGYNEWWLNGILHREDGPAFIGSNGVIEWWLNGVRHRDDGPAIEYLNGFKAWFKNGLRHRDNGPAVERVDGYNEWWINGILQPDKTNEDNLKSQDNKFIMKKEINNILWWYLNPDLLVAFNRDQLRSLAKKMNIKRGRNKADTIFNIVKNQRRFNAKNIKVNISLEINLD